MAATAAAATSAPVKDSEVPSLVDLTGDRLKAAVAPRTQNRTPLSKSPKRLTLRCAAGVEAGPEPTKIDPSSAGSMVAVIAPDVWDAIADASERSLVLSDSFPSALIVLLVAATAAGAARNATGFGA